MSVYYQELSLPHRTELEHFSSGREIMISGTHFKASLLLIPLMTLSACITARMSVKSEPTEASVYVKIPNTETRELIGKTPLTMTMKEFQDKAKIDPSNGELVEVDIEKKDFTTQKMLIPATRFGHISTTILSKLEPGNPETAQANRLLQHLFNAQKFANDAEFERAEIELDKALEIDATFTRALSLRGSIYFIQKKYDESARWFEKALAVDPQFEDSIKMINQIKKITGRTAFNSRAVSSDGTGDPAKDQH
jgi:Flp pilus assembly protein TadD